MSLFISFEGIDGCGKSTHLALLRSYLEEQGYSPVMPREPGGTVLGEKIRQLLLEKSVYSISAESELLLFLASRAQICRELIAPSLAEDKIVICDRFMDSSVAYQGYGRGLGAEQVKKMNEFAVAGLVPDLTLLLDVEPERAAERLAQRKVQSNRLDEEGLDFMRKVREGFLQLAQEEPERIKIVSTAGDKESAQTAIRKELRRFLP